MKKILHYTIRQCEQSECRLRYPLIEGSAFGETCPRCGSRTQIISSHFLPGDSAQLASKPRGPRLQALLDNIRSAWNVGSMFRTADGVGMEHLYLCGITPTPDNPKVAKTALNAEKAIPWTYFSNGLEFCLELKRAGARLWALESSALAEHLSTAELGENENPIVLVVGNETCGIDPDILAQCERAFQIPMVGVKGSYNVAVAFGIAAYSLRFVSEWSNPTG